MRDADDLLPEIAKSIKSRLRNDYDIAIGITGGEGVGKSTVGIQLARLVYPEFTLKNNIIFNPETMIEQVSATPRYSANLIDEAVRALYSRTWHERRSILINKYLRVVRKDNKCLIFNIPHLLDLDSGVRNRRLLLWIWVLERNKKTGEGKAAIFINDQNQLYGEPWGIDEGKKLFNKLRGMKFLTRPDLRDKYLSQLPAFMDFFTFRKLEDELYKEYEVLAKAANTQLEFMEEEENKYKSAFYTLAYMLNGNYKVPLDEISSMCNKLVSSTAIGKYIRMERKKRKRMIQAKYAPVFENEDA